MSLNEYQQKLIEAIAAGGTIIGEACPGSGKTRTMEEAVSHLINVKGVSPNRIGVFTFSRKSAAEARRRIAKTIIPGISDDELKALENGDDYVGEDIWSDEVDPKREMIKNWICTIHGLSYRLLKANGYSCKILASQKELRWQAESIVKDGLKELKWDESPKAVWHWVSKAINEMVSIHNYSDADWFARQMEISSDQAAFLSILYRRYIKFMNRHNLVDFDMMQADLVKLIRNNEIDLSNMFDYVFVDEAQDNNRLQNEIIRALTVKANLIMIGDLDQALYSFRGAMPDVLREIEGIRLNLPINYRSTIRIVEYSARLIEYSYNGLEQFLKPFQARPDAPQGSEIQWIEAENFEALIDEIVTLIGEDTEDLAILSRTRAECAAIHTGLVAANVPAINHSGGLLFGSPHIRKVLAYAHLACDYQGARDNLEILSEIANVASKDFKAPMTRRRHAEYCQAKPWQNCGCPIVMEEGIDYSHNRFYGAKSIQEAGSWQGVISQQWETNRGGYPTLAAKGARDLVSFVNTLGALVELNVDAYDVLVPIIEECIKPWLIAEEGLNEEDLSENGKDEDFQLLYQMVEKGMTLEKFLDKVEWLSKQSQKTSSNAVNIGTIHWSKGAEFKRVIVNLTRCPLQVSKPKQDQLPVGKPPTIEEERRLAFVAVTRAKEECYVVNSREWLGNKLETSRFIKEMGL